MLLEQDRAASLPLTLVGTCWVTPWRPPNEHRLAALEVALDDIARPVAFRRWG